MGQSRKRLTHISFLRRTDAPRKAGSGQKRLESHIAWVVCPCPATLVIRSGVYSKVKIRLLPAVPFLLLGALASVSGDYISARQKFDLIEGERLKPGSRLDLSASELTAYAERGGAAGRAQSQNPVGIAGGGHRDRPHRFRQTGARPGLSARLADVEAAGWRAAGERDRAHSVRRRTRQGGCPASGDCRPRGGWPDPRLPHPELPAGPVPGCGGRPPLRSGPPHRETRRAAERSGGDRCAVQASSGVSATRPPGSGPSQAALHLPSRSETPAPATVRSSDADRPPIRRRAPGPLARAARAADALGDVLAGQLDVDAAQLLAHGAVDVESLLHLRTDVLEVARLRRRRRSSCVLPCMGSQIHTALRRLRRARPRSAAAARRRSGRRRSGGSASGGPASAADRAYPATAPPARAWRRAPTFTPTGFSMPRRYSMCAPSGWLVRSPPTGSASRG